MEQEAAIVMTFDWDSNHFNAILLDHQLKLISSKGTVITLGGSINQKVQEQTDQALKPLKGFFMR